MESVQRQTDLTNSGAIAFLSNDHPGLMGKLSASGWFDVEGPSISVHIINSVNINLQWLVHVNINILKGNGRTRNIGMIRDEKEEDRLKCNCMQNSLTSTASYSGMG
jgi:thiosulfate reductase cytochrome b subunit